ARPCAWPSWRDGAPPPPHRLCSWSSVWASFHEEGQSGHDQNHMVGLRGDPLVEPALQIAEATRERIDGHDSGADFVGDQNHRYGGLGQRLLEPVYLRINLRICHHEVGKPERQTVDQNRRLSGGRESCGEVT